MKDQKFYYFQFLPYAIVKEDFSIAGVNFCSYIRTFKDLIKEKPNFLKELDKFIWAFHDISGNKIEDATFIYMNDNPLRNENFEESEHLKYALDSLCYSLMSGELRLTFIDSDNFKPYYLKLAEDSSSISLALRTGRQSIQGPGLNKICASINPCLIYKPSDKILRALEYCIRYAVEPGKNNNDDYRRILRSIHWFNMAHRDEMFIQQSNQILMMSIAFETLLNPPSDNIMNYITNVVQILIKTSSELKGWMKNFYKLRSYIIHGKEMKPNDYLYKNSNPHIKLARLTFNECIRNRLSLLGLFTYKKVIKDISFIGIEEYLIPNKERFKFIKQKSDFEKLKKDKESEWKLCKYLYTINKDDISCSVEEYEEIKEILEKLRQFAFKHQKELEYIKEDLVNYAVQTVESIIRDKNTKLNLN